MPIVMNETNIEDVIYNGTQLDKVVCDGVVVWEAFVEASWQTNTYINTGAGHTQSWTKEWEHNFGFDTRPTKLSIWSNNNAGNTLTWRFYGWNGSSWDELATIKSQSGGDADVNTNKMYQKYKLSQQGANWKRDDGNWVFSCEPWKIHYLVKKQ